MRAKRAEFKELVLLAFFAFSSVPWAVAEEKSILEGANVIGTDLYTKFYEHNSLISDSFGSFEHCSRD